MNRHHEEQLEACRRLLETSYAAAEQAQAFLPKEKRGAILLLHTLGAGSQVAVHASGTPAYWADLLVALAQANPLFHHAVGLAHRRLQPPANPALLADLDILFGMAELSPAFAQAYYEAYTAWCAQHPA